MNIYMQDLDDPFVIGLQNFPTPEIPEDAVLLPFGGSTSETNMFKGCKLTEEHKQAFCYANKGRVKSEETKRKWRESYRAGGYTDSEETRRKKSESAKKTKNALGYRHSEETKALYSAQRRGVPKPKVECPHCKKSVAINMANRWHFDNCKHR